MPRPSLMHRIRKIMARGEPVTLLGLAQGMPHRCLTTGLSARIRDLRKEGWAIETKCVRQGLYQYTATRVPASYREAQ